MPQRAMAVDLPSAPVLRTDRNFSRPLRPQAFQATQGLPFKAAQAHYQRTIRWNRAGPDGAHWPGQSMTKPTRTVIETLGRTKTDSHVVTLEFEYATRELFVCFDRKPVAKRGHPKTEQARTWIALEPGVVVRDFQSDEGEGVEIEEQINRVGSL